MEFVDIRTLKQEAQFAASKGDRMQLFPLQVLELIECIEDQAEELRDKDQEISTTKEELRELEQEVVDLVREIETGAEYR